MPVVIVNIWQDWTGDMEDDDHDYDTEYDITSAILRDDKESFDY